MRKKGGTKDKTKQLGVITRFNEDGMPVEGDSDDDENGGESNDKSKDFTNGSYVYLAKR